MKREPSPAVLRAVLGIALLSAAALALVTLPLRSASAPARIEVPAGVSVSKGFTIEAIARIPDARELAFAPNGDLFVGTSGDDVMLLRDAEGTPHAPITFATFEDAPAAGVAVTNEALYVGTRFGVWRIPYKSGDARAEEGRVKIADVRLGLGEGHSTTTVAIAHDRVYVGVGSSCNVCTERDPTRASVQVTGLKGGNLEPKAVHIRNPIAVAVNPATGNVWAGVAGQDELERGHPYEIFDPITAHQGAVDYGWPTCYDDHHKATSDADCAKQTLPRVVFPAYDTPIGAAFYPARAAGRHVFPAEYAGGAFVALHGSWHQPHIPPRVAYVPLHGDAPATAVDWGDPNKQWRDFVWGFQRSDGSRTGRPTGVAVGPEGSLFVADDDAGLVYRIRPARG